MSVFGNIFILLLSFQCKGVLSVGAQRPGNSESYRRISNINQQGYRRYAFSSDENDNYSDNNDADELTDEELEASVGKWDEKIARFNK